MTKARRPTAADRDLADHIRRLPFGSYRIDSIDEAASDGTAPMRYCGLARMKREGQLTLEIGVKRIDIYPSEPSA